MTATALTLTVFLALAPHCAGGVHSDTLAPVIETESRFALYAVGINRDGRSIGSRRFASKPEAAAAVKRLLAAGVSNLDLGPAQISWKAGHLQRRGLAPADAFEPCSALRIANDVLADCWTRAPAREEQARIDEALSCYNTGGFTRGLARERGGNGYAGHVRAAAERIVPALRLAGREVAPLLHPRTDAASPSAEAAPLPPACAPSWDPWARLACERRTHRPAPASRQGETPTTALAHGGARAVASNTPDLSGAQR